MYNNTKLRMGGMPVKFVKWGPSALIYARVGSEQTLASMSRGMVRRLLQDGTLEIEGFRPYWAHVNQSHGLWPQHTPIAIADQPRSDILR